MLTAMGEGCMVPLAVPTLLDIRAHPRLEGGAAISFVKTDNLWSDMRD